MALLNTIPKDNEQYNFNVSNFIKGCSIMYHARNNKKWLLKKYKKIRQNTNKKNTLKLLLSVTFDTL